MTHTFLTYQIHQLQGVGNKGKLKILSYLLEHPGDWNGSVLIQVAQVYPKYQAIFLKSIDAVQQLTQKSYEAFTSHTHFIGLLDEEYPDLLSEIYNPPIALYLRGDLSLLSKRSLAVIGSRNQTRFGKEMIDEFIPSIIKENGVIVSGLAKGNDTYAHQTAIRHQGSTIGVLGCGLNRIYPKENQALQHYMSQHQLVISEYPNDSPPLAYHFPERNRIIAGLSKGIFVVEAKQKSGTYITAEIGLQEGRSIFTVPNHPKEENSKGCLDLIKEGAKCCMTPQDILTEW